ncbi:hypothetical protein ACFLWI_01710 [Chloroflexota bacterium]
MVRPRTLLVTGKTEQQWIDEMRVLELAEEQGIRKPKVITCYLCKRAEGDNSLSLIKDKVLWGADSIVGNWRYFLDSRNYGLIYTRLFTSNIS